MARPLKHTIDYFPHFVNAGKTLLILQNEFGNDGYAFWFKLLSLLCKTDGQVYDYNNPAAWRLLLAETCVKEDIADRILKLLAEVEAIDPALYQGRVIWVQNLVDNLSDVYTRRRNGSVPTRPVVSGSHCLRCGNKLIGKRKGTKYCSDTCRQKGHRDTLIRDTEKGLMSTETELSSTETSTEPVIDNINPINVSRKPQTRPDYTRPDHTRPDHTKKETIQKKGLAKKVYGEFKNVLLTDEEYQKLKARFGAFTLGKIEALSEGIASRGYKYSSHYATILSWHRRDELKGGQDGAHKANPRAVPTKYTRPEDL